MLLWEGRLDEFRRLLREIGRVGTLRDRTAALRELWRLDSVVVAAEEFQPILDQAALTAPHDNRIWLGAHTSPRNTADTTKRVDTWTSAFPTPRSPGSFPASSCNGPSPPVRPRKPGAHCDRSRPKRLPPRSRLPSAPGSPRRRNDPSAERSALEQLIAVEPGNTAALDRLAALAQQAGDPDRAAALRRRQEEALRDKDRYRRLMIENRDPIPRDELHERARLAERLGRWYEAQGWLTLALEREPADRAAREALDRLARDAPRPITLTLPGASLLDLVRESGNSTASATEARPSRRTAPSRSIRPPRSRSATMPARPDSTSLTTTAKRRNTRSPRRSAGAWPCSTTTAMAGSTSISSRAGPSLPGSDPSRSQDGDRLFRNRRDGTFEDVTTAAGIARIGRGYAFGVASGDYDNDGRPDLFVTRFGSYVLLHNRGDGTFEDATAARRTGRFARLADLGGLRRSRRRRRPRPLCLPLPGLGRRASHALPPPSRSRTATCSCLPLGFPALPDHLFRNDGGRFVDVTAAAGIVDRDGRGLGVVAADLDDDGRIDLFVANDMTANRLFHNLGGLRFEEIGHPAGVACNAEGGYQAGMGIACGDLDRDGRPDLAVTNFFGESTTFYRNLGDAMFADATSAVGLKAPSRFLLGFGITFLDVNNDGCLDLATANGHIHDLRPKVPYAMPAQLLMGDSKGRLTDVTEHAGPPWTVMRIGRGLARADLDNDGRIDLLLVAQNSPTAYFHNRTKSTGHFLTVRLEGTRSNRDAIGARLDGHGGRSTPDRLATRWRQLCVGRGPAAPFRTRPGAEDRRDRSALALRPRGPLPRPAGRHGLPHPRGGARGVAAHRLRDREILEWIARPAIMAGSRPRGCGRPRLHRRRPQRPGPV